MTGLTVVVEVKLLILSDSLFLFQSGKQHWERFTCLPTHADTEQRDSLFTCSIKIYVSGIQTTSHFAALSWVLSNSPKCEVARNKS